MKSSPGERDGRRPSSAAAALVGLLSLGVALSPQCAWPDSSPRPPSSPAPAPASTDGGAGNGDSRLDGGSADTEVSRSPDGTIVGQLLGSKVGGAEVTLAGSGVWPPRTKRLDDSGEFRFEEVPEGIYSVSARHGTQVAEPREGLWLRRGGHVYLALRLEPGATLSGHVLRASDGSPIADAELLVSPDSLSLAPRHARSDASGAFRLEGLLARPQRLSASTPGYVPLSGVEVTPGRPVDLRMTAAAQVSGVVYDALDHPVVGARVEVRVGGASQVDAVVAGPAADFTRMSNLGTTTGPVPRIPLSPTSPGIGDGADESPWAFGGGPMAVTDAEGRFTVEGVPPGSVTLLATHTDHAPATLPLPRLHPGQRLTDTVVVLPDGSLVHGRVVDSRGFPAAGVPLLLRAEREPLARILVTGRDGSFSFPHVLGVASLTASPPGLPERRERLQAADSGEMEIELRLEDAYIALEGRVVDQAGFPRVGAQIQIQSLRYQAPTTRLTFSGVDGSFTFTGLPAPPWVVRGSLMGCVDSEETLEEAPSGPVELVLREAGELHLTLHSNFDDTPILDAAVRVEQAGRTRTADIGATPGSYVVRGLDVGSLTVFATAANYLPLQRDAELHRRPGSVLSLDLGTLRLAVGGSLEGSVTDMHGAPVPGASLTLDGTPVEDIVTDASGHFLITGITPDTYQVGASHPQAGEAQRPESMRVYRDQVTPGADVSLPAAVDDAAEQPASPGLASGVALRVETRGGHVVIEAVGAGSTAAAAGLRVGDVLLRVDQTEVTIAGQARSALRGPAGKTVALSIRRGARTRRVVVERERYSPP